MSRVTALVQVAKCAVANLVRIFLHQAFRLVVIAIFDAVVLQPASTAGAVADSDANAHVVIAGAGRARAVVHQICGAIVLIVVVIDGRELHLHASAPNARIENRAGKRRDLGDIAARNLIARTDARAAIRIVGISTAQRCTKSLLQNGQICGVRCTVSTRQHPAKRIDGGHADPVHEVTAPFTSAVMTGCAAALATWLKVAVIRGSGIVAVGVALTRIKIAQVR